MYLGSQPARICLKKWSVSNNACGISTSFEQMLVGREKIYLQNGKFVIRTIDEEQN